MILKTIVSFLNLSIAWAQPSHQVGVLFDDKVFFLFQKNSQDWEVFDQTPSQGENFQIFFDNSVLGTLKLGPQKPVECYPGKNLNDAESFEELAALSTPLTCPQNEKELQKMKVIYSAYYTAFPKVQDEKTFQKALDSKRINFEWGGWAGEYKRPLLIEKGAQNISDPEKWKPLDFSKLSSKTRQQILKAALQPRKVQKCTGRKSLKLNTGHLEVQKVYANQEQDKIIAPIKVKSVKGLVQCNGNELGIPSALVVYNKGNALDLLKVQNWNYRDLEVLEAADLDGDGQSEILFADYGYNNDGFSLYDFKSQKLVKNGQSSH